MSLQLFNTVFSPFYQSQTQSALILTLSTSPFLFCSFSDIETPPDTPTPSSPFWRDLQFPVLWGEWSIQNLLPSEVILRHLVPHGQFVIMRNARRHPWGWPVVIALPDTQQQKKKDTGRDTQKERMWSRGRMNLTKAPKQIRPTQQSQGSMQPGCQHLSLVKCSLSDNVTLITESPDSDFLSFYV